MAGMNRFFYAPGMMYPYWIVSVAEDWPKPGDRTTVAMNSAASTDMGDLYGDEFERMFPNAFEISPEQYHGQTINPDHGLAWAMMLKNMVNRGVCCSCGARHPTEDMTVVGPLPQGWICDQCKSDFEKMMWFPNPDDPTDSALIGPE